MQTTETHPLLAEALSMDAEARAYAIATANYLLAPSDDTDPDQMDGWPNSVEQKAAIRDRLEAKGKELQVPSCITETEAKL